MKPFISRYLHKVGLPPGSLIHVGPKHETDAKIHLIEYNETQFRDEITTPDTLNEAQLKQTQWIDVLGVHNPDLVRRFESVFSIDSLVLEDIMNPHQLPKLTEYENYLFTVLKDITMVDNQLKFEQVSFVMLGTQLISFQEHEDDLFTVVKERLRQKKGAARFRNIDYLLFAVLDYVVDRYFVTLKKLDERIQTLMEIENRDITESSIHDARELRRQLSVLCRYLVYTKDTVINLKRYFAQRDHYHNDKYWLDLHDHVLQVLDVAMSFNDDVDFLNSRFVDVVTMRTNDVMRVLTVVASIFLPLSFLAGVYGMNFRFMPELEFHYGYFIILGIFFLIVITLLILYKRNKWI